MALKTHLEPFRESLKVPPVGQPKNLFFLRVYVSNGRAFYRLREGVIPAPSRMHKAHACFQGKCVFFGVSRCNFAEKAREIFVKANGTLPIPKISGVSLSRHRLEGLRW